LRSGAVILIVSILASLPLARNLHERLPERARLPVDAVLLILGLLACTGSMVSSTYNPFLYFRF
ncbi:MAG: MBOAT family protein, partial [Oscillospiraceae bacterium]|nr:MBOAT family protein [Oscillospiraceae bacterium]